MAGFKTTLKAYKPQLFITFDGDAFDENSRGFTASPPVILDESGFGNHGILQQSSTQYLGYRAGMPSQVGLEPGGQYSVGFGYYGKQVSANQWEKAYVEVPHSASFAFPNMGRLSVVWMMNKWTNEEVYRNTAGSSYLTANLRRPVFIKSGVFRVSMYYPYASTQVMEIELPGSKTMTWAYPTWFHGANQFMALTWDVQTAENGDKVGTARLYCNGAVVATQSFNYYDSYPVMNVPNPIQIGGYAATSFSNHDDRNTSCLQIDQFAIFDRTLSENEVSRLFRKTLSYQDMILAAKPYAYWPMQDIEDPNTTTAANLISASWLGRYVGGTTRVVRNQPGVSQVPGSKAVYFSNGGQFLVTNQNGVNNGSVVNINGDYTVEFWFTAESNSTAVLFSMSGEEFPFNGITLTLNMHQNQFRSGGLQLQETEVDYVSATGNYNDGREHHCAIVRRGGSIELWVDGIRIATKPMVRTSTYLPGVISMFTAAPGRQSTSGKACQMALYSYALDPQLIVARSSYQKIYKIRGIVTLRGVPTKANVRLYSHVTGQMIGEVISDASSGDYLAELFDNRNIDMMVLDVNNPTIRYRVYGPVVPSEYEDSPT